MGQGVSFDLGDDDPCPPVQFDWDASRMSRAIRDFDWSGTPLGPMAEWPVSLTSTVRTMLGQRHAHSLFWGPQLTLIYNDAYAPALGRREGHALGRPLRDVWADVYDDILPLVREALAGRGTFSEEMKLVMTRNGYDEETFWTFTYSPLYDDSGQVAGMLNITVDVTSGVSARHSQQVMQQELVHRIKNILAVTSTVVSSSLRNADSLEEARAIVAARIMALAKAQGLMTELGDTADIVTVVARSIEPHHDGTDRFVTEGPSLALTAQQAVGLSLVVYELATNAAKYGALSVDTGRVSVRWQVTPEGMFQFDWVETGGPAVGATAHQGFGSSLTNMIAPSYFDGTGQTEFARDGLRYRLSGRVRA